ncbi:MAG: hypothetical protein PHV66_09855, partial [Bacteroidales bacterium]|nr:hypothetical protein [Bacteroidales bacterium]
FLWRFLRRFLSKNKSILNIRIQYNNLLIFISSFIGTLFLISLFVFRHIPTAGEIIILSADLTKQNNGFNIITAICTFIATISSGLKSNRELSAEARRNNIPEETIQKVTRQHLQKSAQNGLLLSLFTIWVTRLMPCSHDLSVLSFEFIYFISPLTFDRLVRKTSKPNPIELPIEKIS